MFKNLNLNFKIFISLIISFIILFILISISIYSYLNKRLIDEKLGQINKLATEQVDESYQIFKNNLDFTKIISKDFLVKNYLLNPTNTNKVKLLSSLNNRISNNSKYLSLYLLDKNGVVLVSTDLTFTGHNYSFRDYYKEGIKGNSNIDLLLGKTSHKFGYYFSNPVFDDDKNIIGVFVSKVSVNEIHNAIINSQISKESSLMLTDKYGIIILSTKSNRFLKSVGVLSEEQKNEINKSNKYLFKKITSLHYPNIQQNINNNILNISFKIKDKKDGDTEVITISKIGNYPFYLISETGLRSVQININAIIFMVVKYILLAIVITTFILYKLILNLLLPLKKINKIATKISNGNFSERLNTSSNDIIGDLSTSFNKMAENLDSLYKDLDNKVKDRTVELELSKNKINKTLLETEKLNKIMIGRELEMIKLKKEILKLKSNNSNLL